MISFAKGNEVLPRRSDFRNDLAHRRCYYSAGAEAIRNRRGHYSLDARATGALRRAQISSEPLLCLNRFDVEFPM